MLLAVGENDRNKSIGSFEPRSFENAILSIARDIRNNCILRLRSIFSSIVDRQRYSDYRARHFYDCN